MRSRAICCLLLLVSCVFAAAPALAQDSSGDPDWSHSLVLYLLAPTIEGTQGIGQLESDLKIDPSTVLDTIQAGFLGGWVAETSRKISSYSKIVFPARSATPSWWWWPTAFMTCRTRSR